MSSNHQCKLIAIDPAKWHLHNMVAKIFRGSFYVFNMLGPAGFEISYGLIQ